MLNRIESLGVRMHVYVDRQTAYCLHYDCMQDWQGLQRYAIRTLYMYGDYKASAGLKLNWQIHDPNHDFMQSGRQLGKLDLRDIFTR